MRREEFEKSDKPGNAAKLRVGIAVADFNQDITGAMLEGAKQTLSDWKVRPADVHIAHSYGSFELPYLCQKLIKRHKLHAVIALGCIIKGETRHDEFLAQATMQGLMNVSLKMNVPIGLGVLTTENLAQARTRATGSANHGTKAALAALKAALV